MPSFDRLRLLFMKRINNVWSDDFVRTRARGFAAHIFKKKKKILNELHVLKWRNSLGGWGRTRASSHKALSPSGRGPCKWPMIIMIGCVSRAAKIMIMQRMGHGLRTTVWRSGYFFGNIRWPAVSCSLHLCVAISAKRYASKLNMIHERKCSNEMKSFVFVLRIAIRGRGVHISKQSNATHVW